MIETHIEHQMIETHIEHHLAYISVICLWNFCSIWIHSTSLSMHVRVTKLHYIGYKNNNNNTKKIASLDNNSNNCNFVKIYTRCKDKRYRQRELRPNEGVNYFLSILKCNHKHLVRKRKIENKILIILHQSSVSLYFYWSLKLSFFKKKKLDKMDYLSRQQFAHQSNES